MNRFRSWIAVTLCCAVTLGTGCGSGKKVTKAKPVTRPAQSSSPFNLVEVARSDRLWTGVAVSKDGRIFVCFPRWSEDHSLSVGEVLSKDVVEQFPAGDWNRWESGEKASDRFVCVQAVYIDSRNDLWVVDAGNPAFAGVVAGGAKLVRIDLQKNRVAKTYQFDETIAPLESYLNDVRVDNERGVAYITDSGTGAIIVVDLSSGSSRRLLADHGSTKSEGLKLKVAGKTWKMDGETPDIHVDGLALDTEGDFLYYQALTGATLYRVPGGGLRDASLSVANLELQVEKVATPGPSDAILFADDHAVYFTSLESSSIRRWTKEGTLETVVKDSRLSWPDSFSESFSGIIYVTTSQIHLGDNPSSPYRIFRLSATE